MKTAFFVKMRHANVIWYVIILFCANRGSAIQLLKALRNGLVL